MPHILLLTQRSVWIFMLAAPSFASTGSAQFASPISGTSNGIEFLAENDVPLSQPSLIQPSLLQTESRKIETRKSRRSRLSDIPFSLGTTLMSDANSGLTNYDAKFKFPILKLFGSPPPLVTTGFSFTELHAAPSNGLPRSLFEYTLGVSKVFPINDRWTVRSMVGVGLATDNKNRTGDAWQFRGGIFGIYRWSEQWQWTIGAIALGREDLPVVPALGVIWQPSESVRLDLIPPHPKFSILLDEQNDYQNWIYIGGGFDGTTWAYQTELSQRDRLTYGDLRLVLGWIAKPKGKPGMPFVRGRKYNIEMGYVFSRELEFDQEQTALSLDDAWMIRLESRY